MVLPWNCPRSVGTKVCQYWHSQVKAHQHLEAFCVVAEAQQCCPGNPGTPDHPLRQKVERNSCDARTAERGSKPRGRLSSIPGKLRPRHRSSGAYSPRSGTELCTRRGRLVPPAAQHEVPRPSCCARACEPAGKAPHTAWCRLRRRSVQT